MLEMGENGAGRGGMGMEVGLGKGRGWVVTDGVRGLWGVGGCGELRWGGDGDGVGVKERSDGILPFSWFK